MAITMIRNDGSKMLIAATNLFRDSHEHIREFARTQREVERERIKKAIIEQQETQIEKNKKLAFDVLKWPQEIKDTVIPTLCQSGLKLTIRGGSLFVDLGSNYEVKIIKKKGAI